MAAMGVSCFGNDMAMPGSWTAVMDLGGRFAGTLGGIMNMIGMIGGLLAPWTIPRILEAAGNTGMSPSSCWLPPTSSARSRGLGLIR